MNSWVPKTNTIIVAVVFLIASIFVYVTFLFVVRGKINSIELAYSNTASTLALEEESRKIKIITEENSSQIESVNKYFVEKGDEVLFIEDVERLAKESGIKFDIVSISPVKPQSSNAESKKIAVKMNIQGSWSKILLFIDGLEKLPFGISIQGFNLDKPS